MTYTAIPDADLATDKPITQAKARLLRDNPIAIANGDSGAPKIQTAALESGLRPRYLIGEETLSAINGHTFSSLSGYDFYELEIFNLYCSAADDLVVRTGSGTVHSGVAHYGWGRTGNAVYSSNSSDSEIQVATLGTSVNNGICGFVKIYHLSQAVYTQFVGQLIVNGVGVTNASGVRRQASAHDLIRVATDGAGTLTGTVRLYGYRT
jgi:hypothetical protein